MKTFFVLSSFNRTLHKPLAEMEVRNVLTSYYYIRNMKHDALLEMLRKLRSHAETLFLDSGAHTFFASEEGGNNATIVSASSAPGKKKFKEDPDVYFRDYKEWLSKYGVYFDMIAELDIGSVKGVGYAKICKWRDELNMMGLHDKLVAVSHYKHWQQIFPNGDWHSEWERLLREYPLVAFGDQPDGAALHNHFAIWKKLGLRNQIHGFAETKPTKLMKYPMASTDSSTWLIGSRFGIMYCYDKQRNRFITIPVKKGAINPADFAKLLKHYKKFGISTGKRTRVEDFNHPDYRISGAAKDRQTISAFFDMEKAVTAFWLQKGIDFDRDPPLVLKGGSNTIKDTSLII